MLCNVLFEPPGATVSPVVIPVKYVRLRYSNYQPLITSVLLLLEIDRSLQTANKCFLKKCASLHLFKEQYSEDGFVIYG